MKNKEIAIEIKEKEGEKSDARWRLMKKTRDGEKRGTGEG